MTDIKGFSMEIEHEAETARDHDNHLLYFWFSMIDTSSKSNKFIIIKRFMRDVLID